MTGIENKLWQLVYLHNYMIHNIDCAISIEYVTDSTYNDIYSWSYVE